MPSKPQAKSAKNDKTDKSKHGKNPATTKSVQNVTGKDKDKTTAAKTADKNAVKNDGAYGSDDFMSILNAGSQNQEDEWLNQVTQLIEKKKKVDTSDKYTPNLYKLYNELLKELSLRCGETCTPVFTDQKVPNISAQAVNSTTSDEKQDKALQDKLAESAARINELGEEKEKLNAELESSRNELKKLKTSKTDENADFRKEIENLKKKLQEYENKIKVSETNTSNDNSVYLQQKLNDQEENLKQKTEQIVQLKSSLSKEIENLNKRKEELENTLTTVTNKFEAKLDEEIEKRKSLESQNEELKQEKLKTKADQMESTIKHDGITNEQITRLTGENERLKVIEKKLEEKISQMKNDEKKWQNDIKVLTEKNNGLEQIVHDINKQLEEEKNKLKKEKQSALKGPDQKLKELQEENDKLRDRLSQIAGSKLTEGNPAIADLGDPNRPTQLGEKFSELYDNEWTDAMEELVNAGDEKTNINTLRTIVEKSYEFGKTRAADYAKGLEEALLKLNKSIQVTPEISKLIKDHRKNIAMVVADSLHNTFLSSHTEYNIGGDGIKKFIRKAVALCWLMAIQDPPVILTTKMSGKFDTDRFRHYTKSGSTVDYVVWPVVFLHEGGPIICKGVAQGK